MTTDKNKKIYESQKKTMDKIMLTVKKEQGNKIRQYCKDKNIPMNKYIKDLIEKDMNDKV